MGNISLGDAGEDLALKHLLKSGYKIIAQKYREKTGEIDIIAEEKGTIVFVEVKTRSSNLFGSPAEAVSYSKQQKIINTALLYLRKKVCKDVPVRFDIIEVTVNKCHNEHKCNHIKDAFGK